jgi:hypothetical protein
MIPVLTMKLLGGEFALGESVNEAWVTMKA